MEKYIVQEGDNIITIAKKFGVKIMDIITANDLDDAIYLDTGLELVIPVSNDNVNNNNSMDGNDLDKNFDVHVVKKGDNLYQISKMHDISVDDLVLINGLKKDEYLHIGQKVLVPKKGMKVYLTKDGDTLKSVIDSLGLKENEVLLDNEIFLLPEQMIVYRIDN